MGIDPITAGIGAAGSIVGGLLGSKGSKSTSTAEPWKAQQPYLKAGMTDAAYQYGQQRGSGYFGGDMYANLNPNTQNALNGIYGYQGQGATNANTLTGAGANLTGSGTGGLQNAASNLAGFNPQDPTQANIQNAGMYANNPALDGAIDAASRDVTRNLSEVQLPGIARGADANGNLNSSRTGIAEGIAMRGAADRVGDIGATMRNDAYQNGLNLSEQARSTNQGDYLNAQNQAGALSDRAISQGYGGISGGQGLYYDNMDAAAAAGGLQQQDQQGNLDEAFMKWQGQDQRPWELLNKYQGAITGAGSYPSTTASSGGGFGGAVQGALGGAAAGLGLYGSYKNLNTAAPVPKASYNGLY
jgi:hypothetical protein